MAKSYDIADLMTSDGEYLTDQVRRKINGNFRRVLQIMQSELPSQQQQSTVTVVTQIATQITEDILDARLPEVRAELFDDLCPVGSVIVTATSSDPRLSHGTWEQVGGGRYVLAAGGGVPVLDEGGESEFTISEENLPALSHEVEVASAGAHAHVMSRAVIDTGAYHDASGAKSIPGLGADMKNTPFDLGQFYRSNSGLTTSAGSHAHEVTVADHGSEEPEPIPLNPEYISLLFYRRTA